jgi:GNAT superfamily N-acetyltransferase
MQLTKISSDNLTEAVEVAREIFPYEIHKDGFWPEVAYKMAIEEQKPNFAYYLASDGGMVVGITGHYPPEDGKAEIWLGWYGVIPACRRKGYGAQILRATAEIIAQWCDVLNLYSGDREEERPAHRLYLRHGFEQTGRGEVDGAPVLYFRTSIPLKMNAEMENGLHERPGANT